MAALSDVLEHATGLSIDYVVLIDMAAFVDLVGAIGGVDVYVQEPLQAEVSPPREGDPWATIDVDVGWHHLDGFEALAYVRARHGSSDYVRMQRQRCMLRAVAAKSTPVTLLRGFSGIVNALDGSLVTDLPVSFARDMLEMTARLDFDDVVTIGFNPGYYAPTTDILGHPVPDIDRIRQKIASVIRDQDAGIGLAGSGESSECDG
jgi:anionic cell wall polymer biosynthesis LytR-Cps2A-Psr (LCP) family protein